jgi:hypothetical protein
MMVGELDEISYDMEVDGELVRRQLARRIWERRGWATVMVLFEEKRGDGWAQKLAIYRLRRKGDGWQKQASVTLPGSVAMEMATEITQHALEGDEDGD